MNPNKFELAKARLITSAQRVAGTYLLSRYGSAHLIGEPKVELTSTIDSNSSEIVFSGRIMCYATPGLLNQVGINMTVNENDIEVTSEDIQANITDAINAAENQAEHVVAALDGFKLTDDGTKYLKVSHSDLQDANLGLVGKNEYAASPNRAELLQSIVKDAVLDMPVTFTGEFKEPVIEKYAEKKPHTKECNDKNDHSAKEICICDDGKGNEKEASKKCPTCKGHVEKEDWVYCETCKPLSEVKKEVKKSWLTADLDVAAAAPYFQDLSPEGQQIVMDNVAGYLGESDEFGETSDTLFEEVDNFINIHNDGASIGAMLNNDFSFDKEAAPVAIKEDMPRANAHDSMNEMTQTVSQLEASAKDKFITEAVNSLVAMLQGMGYGTAKVAEVTDSKDGFDVMALIDDASAVKAVSIPVSIKDAKVVLPKKAIVSVLISKGLDVHAKLSEHFDMQVLEKMAAAEEKAAYEAAEADAILAERPTVVKTASGSTNEMFLGETDVLEVQKHLLPGHEEMKKGDKISDGADQWELVDTDGNQNDKNKDSASIWKFKKCAPPAADSKEPETKIKA